MPFHIENFGLSSWVSLFSIITPCINVPTFRTNMPPNRARSDSWQHPTLHLSNYCSNHLNQIQIH